MSITLYVSNLSFHTTESDLEAVFSTAGKVESVKLITDPVTGRSRGFAFVQMSSDEDGQFAMKLLNAKEIEGREITVTEARLRT